MSDPVNDNANIQQDMDPIIHELEKQGISFNTREGDFTGLGDVLESTLQSFGVREVRFKNWFNLREYNCNKRKKWLNNLFSWKKRKDEG